MDSCQQVTLLREHTQEFSRGDLALLVHVLLFAFFQELSPAALDFLPEFALYGLAILQGQGAQRRAGTSGGLARKERKLSCNVTFKMEVMIQTYRPGPGLEFTVSQAVLAHEEMKSKTGMAILPFDFYFRQRAVFVPKHTNRHCFGGKYSQDSSIGGCYLNILLGCVCVCVCVVSITYFSPEIESYQRKGVACHFHGCLILHSLLECPVL